MSPSFPVARRVLREIIRECPSSSRSEHESEAERILHNAALVYTPGGRLLDLGAGVCLLAPLCARLGMDVTVVDDFRDPYGASPEFDVMLDLFDRCGVRIVQADATCYDPREESFDCVSAFDTLEHWHRSPRSTLARSVRRLRPGGRLVVSMPNAVDLVNRIRVVFGRSNMARFEDWWHTTEFRGHVREATVTDLRRIAVDLGFARYRIHGVNWWYHHGRLASFLGRSLPLPASLCSAIYLTASHYGSTAPNAFHVPGDPAVVQTHPTLPPAVTAEL